MQIFLTESILIITTIMIINPKVLNCFKIPPCQHLRKCIENSMENMHTDIKMKRIKCIITTT